MSLWKDPPKPVPATSAAAPSPAAEVREPLRTESAPRTEPTSYAPAPQSEPERVRKESLIASDLTIEGKIEGSGSVRIRRALGRQAEFIPGGSQRTLVRFPVSGLRQGELFGRFRHRQVRQSGEQIQQLILTDEGRNRSASPITPPTPSWMASKWFSMFRMMSS